MKMKILVGLPASGKSTIAHGLVINDNYARINYDDQRWFENGQPVEYHFSRANEEKVKSRAVALAESYIQQGRDLVIDNTNLTKSAQDFWARIAHKYGITVEYIHVNTPLQECINRDAARNGWRQVGRAVIERMALWNGMLDLSGRELVLVDLDGTLADLEHRRKWISGKCILCGGVGYIPFSGQEPFCPDCKSTGKVKKDWLKFFDAVETDPLIVPTARWIEQLNDDGRYCVVIVSGRPIDRAGKQTVQWLAKHQIQYEHLFMRSGQDMRDDTIVKQEILDKILASKGKVAFTIDDRPRVIRMWRDNSIKCYDVGNGVEF